MAGLLASRVPRKPRPITPVGSDVVASDTGSINLGDLISSAQSCRQALSDPYAAQILTGVSISRPATKQWRKYRSLLDSPLEGAGFEPSAPRDKIKISRPAMSSMRDTSCKHAFAPGKNTDAPIAPARRSSPRLRSRHSRSAGNSRKPANQGAVMLPALSEPIN